MGGAFVALADDSSATWWNPAGLAAGPFFDLALGRAAADTGDGVPAHRVRATWLSAGTPPLGLSYYRLRIIDIPTAPDGGDREDGGVVVPLRALSASQYGVTLVQTLFSGVHVGTTLKYVRASGFIDERAMPEAGGPSQLLDQAAAPDGGETEGAFDLDVGILAVHGPVRLGAVVRNVREPEFGGLRLPRAVRVGAAFAGSEAGRVPVTVAVDVDLRAYQMASGDRQVVAVGGEGWLFGRRFGIRAGARFNVVGAEERVVTTGASVAVRTGLYVDAHVARGGADEERGWGLAARVSF